MINEEKYANDLLDRFSYNCRECDNLENARFFAIFCVDEIIDAFKRKCLPKIDYEFYLNVKQILKEKL